MNTSEKLITIAQNDQKIHDKGFEDGKKAEYDAFWDAFQQNGSLANYNHAFYRWFGECYKPKYPITTTLITNGFAYSKITDTLVDITLSEDYSGTTLTGIFNQATILKTIRKLVLPSKITNYSNCFSGCTALSDLTVEGEICGSVDLHWSPLSQASVESVVRALSDKASGLTVTFNNTQMENINGGSNWWVNLKATKPNWTFALLDV